MKTVPLSGQIYEGKAVSFPYYSFNIRRICSFIYCYVFSPFLSLPVLLEVTNFTFQRTIYFIDFFFDCFLSFNFLPSPCFGFFYFLRLKEWVTDFKPFLFSYNYLGPFVSANVLYSPLLLDSDQPKGMCVTGGGRVNSQLTTKTVCRRRGSLDLWLEQGEYRHTIFLDHPFPPSKNFLRPSIPPRRVFSSVGCSGLEASAVCWPGCIGDNMEN